MASNQQNCEETRKMDSMLHTLGLELLLIFNSF